MIKLISVKSYKNSFGANQNHFNYNQAKLLKRVNKTLTKQE